MRLAAMVFAFAIVAGMAVVGFQGALADAGNRQAISDETFTPNAGNVQSLDRSNLDNAYYNDTVNVEDENGDQSFEGTDYEWFENNGTIKPLAGGNLDGDASATIDYSYRQTTSEQRDFTQALAVIPDVVIELLPLLLFLVALAAIRGLL